MTISQNTLLVMGDYLSTCRLRQKSFMTLDERAQHEKDFWKPKFWKMFHLNGINGRESTVNRALDGSIYLS